MKYPIQDRFHNPLSEVDIRKPIFIVGAPRSGTSLLRVILNRHPNIGICDETHFFYYVYNRRHAFGDLNLPGNRQRLIESYLGIHRIKRLPLNQDQLSGYLFENGVDYASFFMSILRFYAGVYGKSRCGEKTPHHALYAETICDLFPDCKLIHIVRDPRAVVCSLGKMPWASKSILVNARSWVKYTRGALQSKERPNYFLVKYEDLVLRPEEETRRICEFIEEAYISEMLIADPDSEKQVVPDEWWFQRAKDPLTGDRLSIWKQELTSTQTGLIEWIAGPQMSALGYETFSREPTEMTKAVSLTAETITTLGEKTSQWGRIWYFWFKPTQISREEAWIDSRPFQPVNQKNDKTK